MSEKYDAQRRLLVIALSELIARQEVPKGFWDAIAFRAQYPDVSEHAGGLEGMKGAIRSAIECREIGPFTIPANEEVNPAQELLLIRAATEIHSDALCGLEHRQKAELKYGYAARDPRSLLRYIFVSYILRRKESLEHIL